MHTRLESLQAASCNHRSPGAGGNICCMETPEKHRGFWNALQSDQRKTGLQLLKMIFLFLRWDMSVAGGYAISCSVIFMFFFKLSFFFRWQVAVVWTRSWKVARRQQPWNEIHGNTMHRGKPPGTRWNGHRLGNAWTLFQWVNHLLYLLPQYFRRSLGLSRWERTGSQTIYSFWWREPFLNLHDPLVFYCFGRTQVISHIQAILDISYFRCHMCNAYMYPTCIYKVIFCHPIDGVRYAWNLEKFCRSGKVCVEMFCS